MKVHASGDVADFERSSCVCTIQNPDALVLRESETSANHFRRGAIEYSPSLNFTAVEMIVQ